jgi:hypothetical protein
MAEDHDRDQRCEFPPNVNLKEAECCGERCPEGDYDRQADEGHHAGRAVGKFAPRPADKNETSIPEYDHSKYCGYESRTGEGRRRVPKPMLHIRRPENHRNRESETPPEFVAKHGDGMSGRTIVVSVRL